jgi:Peptidase family C25
MMKRVELKEISVGSWSSQVKTASLRRARVVCCLLTLSAMMLALPGALLKVRAGAPQEKAGKDQAGKDKNKNQNKAPGNVTTQGATKTAAPDEDEGEDPDLPPGFSGRIDKEAYHAGRSDQINFLRGMEPGKPFDVTGRSRAIQHMEAQRNSPSSPQTSGTMWTQIGPAPIPLGQTTTTRVNVSGRVTAVEIDPTNSNNIYVGTAQGGIYRSLDGGTTWLAIFDSAQSLAIGALTLLPGDPTTLYVGTGEANGSADSFAGVGLYRINSVTTTPVLTGPINPVRNYLDGGSNPQSVPAFNGRSISKILVHPTQPGTLLVGVAGGVIGLGADAPFGGTLPPLSMRGMYRVKNADGPAAGATVERIAVSTTDTGQGLCAFDTPCTVNRSVNNMVFDPQDPSGNTLIVWLNGINIVGDGGIYRTTNAFATPATSVTFTQTLTTTSTSTSNGRGELRAYVRSGTTVIYVASGEPSNVPVGATICNSAAQFGALRRSDDGGVTWSVKLAGGGGFCGGQCFYNIGFDVVPGAATTTDKLLLGGNVASGTCARQQATSLDGGATTFTSHSATTHADTHVIKIAPSNPLVVFRGDDGGVWKSTDGGDTWVNQNNTGFHATQFQSVAAHPTDRFITIGGTQDNGTETMLTSPPFTWLHSDDGDGGFAMIDQSTPTTMYHTYFNQAGVQIGYARSLTGGTFGSWSFLGCSGNGTTNGIACSAATTTAVNFYCPTALGPGSPNNTVYIGTDRLLRSSTQGTANVTVSQAPLTSAVAISAIGISPQSDNARMVGQNNGAIWFTTTGSSTLTSLDPVGGGSVIPDKYVTRCVFEPGNQNTAYISLAGYMGGTTSALSHVWRITNLNTTPVLTAINTGLPDVPVNGFVVDPLNTTHLFAGTDIAVYASTDTGATWAVFGTGLPVSAVFDMVIAQPNTTGEVLRIATHGRGMWEIALGPTIAKVIDTEATVYDDGQVLLAWQTGNETDNLGFNVYREQDGQRIRITPQIVAGSALMTGPGPSLEAGYSYRWSDAPPGGSRKVRYWIEDIDLSGHSTWTGPIEAKLAPGKRHSPGRNAVLLNGLGLHAAQISNGVGTAPAQQVAEPPRFSLAAAQLQAGLATQPAVKIAVKQEGWYRVSQADLAAAGLDPKTDPRNVQLFADGQELPINVLTDAGAKLAAIEFYGLGLDTAATNTRIYWLIAGTQAGRRIPVISGKGVGLNATSFAYTVERKDRTIYFSGLRNGDTENFFGPVVGKDAINQTVTLSHVASGSSNAALEVALQGVTRVAHQVTVTINGAAVGTVSFANQARGVAQFAVAPSNLKEGDNTVQLASRGGEQDVSLLDVIRITYQHIYRADSNLLQLTATAGQPVTIDGFTSAIVRIVDVTDANNPQELSGTVKPGKNGYAITTLVSGSGQRRLLAFADSAARQAASVWANQLSNWRQTGVGADLIMLTRREWFSAVEPLKSLRQGQGLSVAVVDIEDVYDEFSFGNKTPQAVKDFILYARNSWKKAPRFALIVGDATYDPKNYLGFGDNDAVPTSLIDTQYMETACDDCLADSNLDGIGEIALGRLPARTSAEVSKMVAKLVSYDGSTSNSAVLLVSDSNEGYNFEAVTAQLRNVIPADFRIEEIDRGRLDPATAKAQLLDAINRGERIVAYTGHGNVDQWRGNLLTSADARALTNGQNLPLFITMTCLNGYFHDVVLDSLAESLIKADRGGAVAVWASSGMTGPSGQELLDQQMLRAIFDTSSGRALTLGEAILRSKALTNDPDVRRTWILFGDPSMRLK